VLIRLTQALARHYTSQRMDEHEPQTPAAAVVDKLVQNHRDFLRFLERRVGSRAEAEDLLQQAFVKSVEHASTLRDGESAVAWFYRMLRNAVIDRQRRHGAADRGIAAFARELDVAATTQELSEAVCACVKTLAATLKPEYADALRRVEVDGVSLQRYAEEAGIQANNAAVRVHRARLALRKRVMASCGTCAEHGCLQCSCQPASAVEPSA
jgi:RNA polymerase sigma factor (sigma-70 family)